MRIVIIGGVAGGMSAATRLRRLSEDAEIIVFERTGNVSFANCGLPYHIGGVIHHRSALLLQTPDSLRARFNLDVRVGHEVLSVDPAARTVLVRNLATGEQQVVGYDALVLSPGATPIRPPIPGAERALLLRSVEDTDALVAASAGVRTAAVIGGGFIGVEMTENLHAKGIQVALIEATGQVMPPMDPEMVAPLHEAMRKAGIDLRLSTSAVEITADEVKLSDGTAVPADLVMMAVGVRPETSLAADAGLDLAPRGGILVDDRFRTSDPAIYAVGDAVSKRDAIDGTLTSVPLANTANLQGRRVADAIMGRDTADRPVLSTAIVGAFGLQLASTGWSEKRARAAGRAVRVIHTHPANHAGYYPGSVQISLKLVVDPETDQILGAQGVGARGVDKRIDVIATAITGHLTASSLAELELSYAPQFGSAKDPINMLGYIASNLRDGLTSTIQWHELEDALADGAVVVDVRTPSEHRGDHIDGSVLLPLDDLRERIGELPEGDLIVHCAVGLRGYLATRVIEQLTGRKARNLDGGMKTLAAGRG